MKSRLSLLFVLGFCALVGAGCGPQAALTDLKVTDITSGYYDAGIVDGMNKLVPSITFRLQNNGAAPISRVQLTVSFWRKGDDGEKDSKEVTGIAGTPVPAGATSAPVRINAEIGYKLFQPRAELFVNTDFKDFSAKLFAKQGGKIVPLGEFVLDHNIIPQAPTAP